MPFFRKKSNEDQMFKARLEHKLYVARESPEPTFDLSECALKDVPSGIYSLCKVFRKESLFLQSNQLTSLDGGGSLQDLAMLLSLDLQNNCFSSLPSGIGYLLNLRTLDLSNNFLVNLPESVGSLKQLQVLNLGKNKLASLPVPICFLPRLAHLDIQGNSSLTLRKLPSAIIQAPALESLEMDGEQLSCVPADVVEKGTKCILAFLAEELGLLYIPPKERELPDPVDQESIVNVFEVEKQQRGLKAQKQQGRLLLEVDREKTQQMEIEVCCALRENRGRLLSHLSNQQVKLEKEVERLHEQREQERLRLVQHLQEVERSTDEMIANLLILSAQEREQEKQEKLQQLHEEEEELLATMQKQQRGLQRHDVLDGMKLLVEEECRQEKRLREYAECRTEMTRSLLSQELESSNILLEAVDRRSYAQMELVQRLQRDEELQRAAVSSLLERSDARSWALVQQVSLVEKQLAQLTAIELQRKNHQLSEQITDLAEKRSALSLLLVHLLQEQASRREQLLHTLNEIERQRNDNADFWLHQYQRLMDSRPNKFIDKERVLDPMLANHLVLKGVVHCLPFLVQWLHDPDAFASVTDEQLNEAGVKSTLDRRNILEALQLYLEERECAFQKLFEPTAPQLGATCVEVTMETKLPTVASETDPNITSGIVEAECVVCLEASCNVIILPCGHMCCCAKCCGPLALCPMCRGEIERKIRVRAP